VYSISSNLKVSIITPCYNSEKTIKDTISSVRLQDYDNIEHLFIDGNSKDNTLEIIKKYSRKNDKLVSENDNGIFDAMNKGIRNSSGEIVGILNSDDFYINRNVISNVVQAFESNKVDCVYADLLFVDSVDTSKIIRVSSPGKYDVNKFKSGWHPPHPAFFVRKEVYEKYGHFDESYPIASDYDLMLRFLHVKKVSWYYHSELIVKQRVGGESNGAISNIFQANLQCYHCWRKYGLYVNPLILLVKPLKKMFQMIKI